VENLLWKRLWTCRKADYRTKTMIYIYISTYVYIRVYIYVSTLSHHIYIHTYTLIDEFFLIGDQDKFPTHQSTV